MLGERSSTNDVVASFPDMQSARQAMLALEQSGIDGANISLGGPAAHRAALDTDPTERDARLARNWLRWSIAGGAAGLVVGAIIGALLGLLVFGAGGAAVWYCALGGAGVGLAIGGLVAPISRTPVNPAAESTLDTDSANGPVQVSVRPPSSDAVARIAEVLEKQGGRGTVRRDPAPRNW
jgi:hypothetical protein